MTTTMVLAETRRRGISLEVVGGKLKYVAPPDSLDDDLRSELRRHKDQLVLTLTGRSEDWDSVRWGTSIGDPTPGIVIEIPNRDRMLAALADPYSGDVEAWQERLAIQNDGMPPSPDDRRYPPTGPSEHDAGTAIIRVMMSMGVTAKLSADGGLTYSGSFDSLPDDDREYLTENHGPITDTLLRARGTR